MFSMKGCGTGITSRPRQALGLLVVVRADALEADIVDVAGLELGVQHGQVRDVLDDQPLQVRAVAVVVGVGRQRDVVAGHALDPLERPGADRRGVERRACSGSASFSRMCLGTMKVQDRIAG